MILDVVVGRRGRLGVGGVSGCWYAGSGHRAGSGALRTGERSLVRAGGAARGALPP